MFCAGLPAYAAPDSNGVPPAQSGQFHPPQTEAEKTLAEILRAIAKSQADLVQKNCTKAEYESGDLCGFNYVPTTCEQDWQDEKILYRTEKQTAMDAIIVYAWQNPKGEIPAAHYHLVYADRHWMLDGIMCSSKIHFNMN